MPVVLTVIVVAFDPAAVVMALPPTVEPAGRWGRQGCDLPYRTLVNMFEFIRDN